MKFWRAFVPNLCISLWLALLTLVILDQYNPMLGFLKGRAFLLLVLLCALASMASARSLARLKAETKSGTRIGISPFTR